LLLEANARRRLQLKRQDSAFGAVVSLLASRFDNIEAHKISNFVCGLKYNDKG
jgi:hypothetical protein